MAEEPSRETTPKTLKEGEVAVGEKDWERIQAKAKDMDRYKRELGEAKDQLDELQGTVTKLQEAQKAKPTEGETDAKAVEVAVAETRRELEKAHNKALAEQARGLKIGFAARLALVNAGAKDIWLGSIDLSDVTDEATAKERVEAFVKENPEIVKKDAAPEPKPPPGVTAPSTGPPAPGDKPPEGPKTSGEREKLLRDHFKGARVAIMRGGEPTTPG